MSSATLRAPCPSTPWQERSDGWTERNRAIGVLIRRLKNCSGLGGTRRNHAAVTTPSIPALPQSNTPRSYPVLSFMSPPMCETVSLVPSTASKPTSCALVVQWRSTLKSCRVRSDGAADRRTVTTAEVDAVRPPCVGCGRLDVGHRGPRTGRKLATERVDVGDARQPAQTEYDLASEGDTSTDVSRVAPLGHEGDIGLFAKCCDRRYLSAVPWTDDGPGNTSKASSPVDCVGRDPLGLDDYMFGSDGLAELLQQTCGHMPILALRASLRRHRRTVHRVGHHPDRWS